MQTVAGVEPEWRPITDQSRQHAVSVEAINESKSLLDFLDAYLVHDSIHVYCVIANE